MHMAARIFVWHPAPVTGGGNRAAGVAVIGAVGRQHLIAAGIQARHANGVFVGIGSGVGEEHFAKPFRGQVNNALSRLAARQVRRGRGDRHQ